MYNELAIFSLEQYAHVGDVSPISFEDPDLNVSLSTNNSSGSAPAENPSGSAPVVNPSGPAPVQNPSASAPVSDVDMGMSSSSNSY